MADGVGVLLRQVGVKDFFNLRNQLFFLCQCVDGDYNGKYKRNGAVEQT